MFRSVTPSHANLVSFLFLMHVGDLLSYILGPFHSPLIYFFLLQIVQLKCGKCGEITQKETYVSLVETVPLPIGKGNTHLIQKVTYLPVYLSV